jgi:hypothetical protein
MGRLARDSRLLNPWGNLPVSPDPFHGPLRGQRLRRWGVWRETPVF